MVDDLLDLSQMESGVYKIRKQDFDLKELLQSIYYRYHNLAVRYKIKLDMDYPDDKLYNGDSLRLEQAIDNILGNAAKYVKDNGFIWINLKLEKDNIKLSIENQGRNIEESDLPHIFDSYYQGKSSIYGTGLGLSITKHIISLHSGTVKVINTDNGVKITIELPLT
jgi:signal transduction histidine kinase